jgi:hypothetical protein
LSAIAAPAVIHKSPESSGKTFSKDAFPFDKHGEADNKIDHDAKFHLFINVAGKVGRRC